MLIGSHVSTAGGIITGIDTADALGFNALALFVCSPRQWKLPPLSDDAIKAFRARRTDSGVEVIVAHASYLLNLAGEKAIRDKSIKALGDELDRCGALDVEYLVLHPGSCPELDLGIKRITDGLDQVMTRIKKKTTLLIEGMAGQGNTIGHRFEHLARILKGVKHRSRYGVCLDTCHLYAAGYDISTPKGWAKTMREFDRVVGIKHIHAMHCNDSQRELGSRVDRHAHIGQGELGKQAFKHVIQDKRLADVPFILETPKGEREKDGRDWDVVNSQILKRFAKAGVKK